MKLMVSFIALIFSMSITAQVKTAEHNGNKKATVSELVGVTDIKITYNRPGVKGREGKIWGQVVQYGFVDFHYGTSKFAPWRAGADENTTIEFSTDVFINGQPLARGKYGFFIAMGKEKATLIFSKDNNAWGSFYYNPASDALRVETPVKNVAESVERLKYEFGGQTDSSAVITMMWEKVFVPFTVSADLKMTQLDEYRRAANDGNFYRYWQNMQLIANFCLNNDVNLEEGLQWADRSVNAFFGASNFSTLSTYAGLLAKANRTHEADSLMKRAMTMGTANDLYRYGNGLVKSKKYVEALEVFKTGYQKYPKEVLINYGMALTNARLGNTRDAIKFADQSILLSPDADTKAFLEKFKTDIQQGNNLSAY